MINTVLDELNARYEMIKSLNQRAETKIQNYPVGRIEIKHIANNTYYYYVAENNSPVLLDKGNKLINDLMQKNYLEKVINVNHKELNVLKKAIEQYPTATAEEIYEQLTEDRKMLVKPIVTPIEQYVQEWQSQPYTPKPIAEGTSFFETLKGERVRSKSEQIIADRLYANGIPYKYECPLIVNGKLIHPDFTILRKSDRKEVYHEHLGKSDDEKYKNDNVPRLNDYILGGYMLGDKLFLSVESSTTPLDTRVINMMISNHYI